MELSTHTGEAFTTDYGLPNDTLYTKLCASISLVFFSFSILKLKRDGRYADVMERAMFNIVPAGFGLDSKNFLMATHQKCSRLFPAGFTHTVISHSENTADLPAHAILPILPAC